jgi:hypothetical protein
MRLPMMMARLRIGASLTTALALWGCGGATLAGGPNGADANGAAGGDGGTGSGGTSAVFVGTWTCMGTATGTDQPNTPPYSEDIKDIASLVANSDGSLTMTVDTQLLYEGHYEDDGSCSSLKWNIEGSTATTAGGQSCPDGEPVTDSVTGQFTVSGNSATISMGFAQPGAALPNGNTLEPSNAQFTGTCTRDVPDTGSDDASTD